MKIYNSTFLIILLIFGFFVKESYSAPPKESPKKWPCDQVYNPTLDLKAIWQGPNIENNIKNWWKDDDVISVVTVLSDPLITEEEGTRIIEDFAKKYSYFGLISKKEQQEKLFNLFAGLYQKASTKRNRQYSGIIKFVERQDSIRNTIGEASRKLRELKKAGAKEKDPEVVQFSSQLKWNTRVFDRRTKLTEYVCEEPVFGEQRIGYQARRILSYIK